MNICRLTVGVDFHVRQQTSCYLKTETGELVIEELKHQDKKPLSKFYAAFPGPVIIGLNASVRESRTPENSPAIHRWGAIVEASESVKRTTEWRAK